MRVQPVPCPGWRRLVPDRSTSVSIGTGRRRRAEQPARSAGSAHRTVRADQRRRMPRPPQQPKFHLTHRAPDCPQAFTSAGGPRPAGAARPRQAPHVVPPSGRQGRAWDRIRMVLLRRSALRRGRLRGHPQRQTVDRGGHARTYGPRGRLCWASRIARRRRTGVAGARGGRQSPAERAASAQARSSRQRVEVLDRRSEPEQVFANPDGAFSSTIASRPVRVRRPDGSWVRVDTTLRLAWTARWWRRRSS